MTELQKQFLQEYVDAYETYFVKAMATEENWDFLTQASNNLDKHFSNDEIPTWYKGAYEWAKRALRAQAIK